MQCSTFFIRSSHLAHHSIDLSIFESIIKSLVNWSDERNMLKTQNEYKLHMTFIPF